MMLVLDAQAEPEFMRVDWGHRSHLGQWEPVATGMC